MDRWAASRGITRHGVTLKLFVAVSVGDRFVVEKNKKIESERWVWRFGPWLIFAVGLFFTLLAESEIRKREEELARSEFELRVGELISGLENSLDTCAEQLRGVVGLFASSIDVDRNEFRTYVEGLNLSEASPGIQGVGFARVLSRSEKEAHVESLRAEGFPDYDIRPEGDRSVYSAVVYLEPFDWRNRRAFGFDMLSEPIRRRAMERARDTGRLAMSDRVKLEQETETDVQAGALIYLPVYRHLMPRDTPTQRREALVGWAYSPLRIGNLVESYLTLKYGELRKRLAITLYDGPQMNQDAIIYRSPAGVEIAGDRFEIVHRIEFAGAVWTVRVRPLASYWREDSDVQGLSVLIFGIVLSALLAAVALMQKRAQQRLTAALGETRKANRALAEREVLLETIYDTTTVAIFVFNTSGYIVHANRFATEMFQRDASNLIGSHFATLLTSEELDTVNSRFDGLMDGRFESYSSERHLRRGDLTEFWGLTTGRVFCDADGKVAGLVTVIADITARRKAEDIVRHQALHDHLTGVANRAFLMDQAARALELAKRYNRRLAILFLDLDCFKPINDEHGHDVGDEVLRQIAARLCDLVRASDTVSRLGGDEFVILVPEFSDFESLETLAKKLLRTVKEPSRVAELTLQVSVSIGIATYPENGDSIESLMQNADWAMYRAKASREYPICFAREMAVST